MTPATHRRLAAACPVMAQLIERHGRCPIRPAKAREPFAALSRAVIHQQLSVKAASTIRGRVVALFRCDEFPSPRQILRKDEDLLRGAGLSRAKVAALKDLARKTLSGVVPTYEEAKAVSDDDLIERLVAVRGVGRWTAEMFLISTLARPDVLAVGDVGLRNGAARAYGLDEAPTADELYELGERWRPFRTTASWYLWQAADAPPDVIP